MGIAYLGLFQIKYMVVNSTTNRYLYCVEYISMEKHFYSNYISCDFDEYINSKKQDGIWRDDIEL